MKPINDCLETCLVLSCFNHQSLMAPEYRRCGRAERSDGDGGGRLEFGFYPEADLAKELGVDLIASSALAWHPLLK